MASSNSLKILQVCQVAPASDYVRTTELSLSFTFIDTIMLILPPVGCIYFYKHTGLNPTLFNMEILPILKGSLSRTLVHFLPLAGRLTWPFFALKPVIRYAPTDSISLTIAESNADFESLVGDEVREVSQHCDYVPELFTSRKLASIMSVQITLFPDKGFSIATNIQHSVVDGMGASLFMKAWAYTAKQTKKIDDSTFIFPDLQPELTPSFDRKCINRFYFSFLLKSLGLSGLAIKYIPRTLEIASNNDQMSKDLVQASFQLSRGNIRKLKENTAEDNEEFNFSTFVITCAYISVCMVKARGGDGNRKVGIVFPADCRSRLDPPVPQNYFGNCIFLYETISEAKDFMQENGVAVIAKKIYEMTERLKKGVFREARKSLVQLGNTERDVQQIYLLGSPRIMFYELDFGWGIPEKATIEAINWESICGISNINGFSMIGDRNGNGGVEVGVSLLRHEMEAFSSFFANGLHVT
ncbi:phenolic glucoside malonyltransferase 1-like [Mercurialis annua]|uniref:phenolic glucoside malonyltransferase 1-like n=1 Tax=Mercurialis annua TaxID=3986 RepID=UPI00215F8226|nr:phenolic glucoside malonyltransferase 1-like [Mercurialis annua]